jgi:hypothetical protein
MAIGSIGSAAENVGEAPDRDHGAISPGRTRGPSRGRVGCAPWETADSTWRIGAAVPRATGALGFVASG